MLVLALAIPLSLAQSTQPSTPQPAPAATPAGGGEAVRNPRAQMQALKFMMGHWTTAENYAPSDYLLKGGTGTGRADIHPGPGNRFMIENYLSDKNDTMGRFGGHSVIWWDAKAEIYKSFWCDSVNACENSFGSGKWDGDKLVFTGESDIRGTKMRLRDTYSAIKPDSFSWKEEGGAPGTEMKLILSVQYTRLSTAEPAEEPSPTPNPKN